MTNPKLTPKQRSFIDHYLENGCNGTQAARDAGYKGNQNTLASVAKDNLRKPHIKSVIDAARAKLKEKLGISAENKRQALWDIAQDGMEKVDVQGKDFKRMKNPLTAIQAITELNKMDGDHAALKIKATVKNQVDYVNILEQARERAKAAVH